MDDKIETARYEVANEQVKALVLYEMKILRLQLGPPQAVLLDTEDLVNLVMSREYSLAVTYSEFLWDMVDTVLTEAGYREAADGWYFVEKSELTAVG